VLVVLFLELLLTFLPKQLISYLAGAVFRREPRVRDCRTLTCLNFFHLPHPLSFPTPSRVPTGPPGLSTDFPMVLNNDYPSMSCCSQIRHAPFFGLRGLSYETGESLFFSPCCLCFLFAYSPLFFFPVTPVFFARSPFPRNTFYMNYTFA